jgi:hypothetical protein
MAQRLTEILLLNLMTADFKNHIFYNSNRRLEEAKQKGITLSDISIGEDCLATWTDRTWDPDTASLHDSLQEDALNLLEAQEASVMVRRDLIRKSNNKLDGARDLGIALEDIQIGLNLLPV